MSWLGAVVPSPLSHPVPLLLALLLSAHGLRKGSLSTSGSIAAFFVGYLSLAVEGNKTFGVVLLCFYLAGSRATKVKSEFKAKCEREEGTGQHKSAGGGGRDAWQVASNGLTGTFAAVAYRIVLSSLSSNASTSSFLPSWLSPISSTLGACPLTHPTLRFLATLSLAHYAACMGDVLASELGILSRGEPWLLFTLRPRRVPRGTNGALSPWGTFCSFLGGLFIGIVYLVTLHISMPACRPAPLRPGQSVWEPSPTLAPSGGAVSIACMAGFGGSMLDSFLGAVCQRTWYHRGTKQVLVGGSLKESSIIDEKKVDGKPAAADLPKGDAVGWTIISGYDILSNGQVNFISSAAVALTLASFDYVVTRGKL